MATATKTHKLYEVTLDKSTYVASGSDPFNALARCVAYEDKSGSFVHLAELDSTYSVEAIGESDREVLAWEVDAS